MQWLYNYPQVACPYADLVATNRLRRREFEYELLDTGVFDQDRYWAAGPMRPLLPAWCAPCSQ